MSDRYPKKWPALPKTVAYAGAIGSLLVASATAAAILGGILAWPWGWVVGAPAMALFLGIALLLPRIVQLAWWQTEVELLQLKMDAEKLRASSAAARKPREPYIRQEEGQPSGDAETDDDEGRSTIRRK